MEAVPDGGWGWFVVVGMALMFIVSMGALPYFGVIFGDLMTELGEGTTSLTTITSTHLAVLMLIGLMNNRLSKSFSFRQIGCFGGLIFFLGSLLSSFSTSVLHLIATYGVMQGFGLGLMIPAAMSSFNSYFNERRTMAMAVSQSLNAAGCCLIPLIVQMLMNNYGYRGAQLIMSAITLHAFLGMVALQPVEKYMKRRRAGLKSITIESRNPNHEIHCEPLLNSAMELKKIPCYPIDENTKLSNEEKTTEYKPVPSAEWHFNLTGTDASTNKACLAFLRWIRESLDLDLLTNPVYLCVTIGVCFTNIADMTFFFLEPDYLQTLDISPNAVSYVVSATSAGDLVGRVFLALVSRRLSQRNRLIYSIGVLGTVMHILAFVCITDYYVILSLTVILGFFRGCIYVTLALVFAEIVSVDRYPAAFGLYHAINGVMFLLFGPFVGMVRDATNSYTACFLTLAGIMSLCLIIWALEMTYRRWHRR